MADIEEELQSYIDDLEGVKTDIADEKTARQQGDELLETLTQFVKKQLLEELDYFNERLDPLIPDDIGSKNNCLIMAENGKVLTEEVRQTWR
jgi:hypothetical protein